MVAARRGRVALHHSDVDGARGHFPGRRQTPRRSCSHPFAAKAP
jgi:hypothetical protein